MIGIEDAEVDPELDAGASSNGVGAPLTDGGAGAGGAHGSGGTHATPAPGAEGGAGAATKVDSELAGAAGEGAGVPAELSLCQRYCAAVSSNCQGPFAVYTSHDTCLAACALMPAGQPGDRNLNSVECRLHAATIASSEVPHYCPIAGPGGNGECGTNCEGYCALIGSVCAEWVPIEQAQCLTDCKTLPDRGSYTTDVGGQDYAGNHIQCRLFHVCAALADDAEQHCKHASGAAPCK